MQTFSHQMGAQGRGQPRKHSFDPMLILCWSMIVYDAGPTSNIGLHWANLSCLLEITSGGDVDDGV